jgi:hypothetical protein
MHKKPMDGRSASEGAPGVVQNCSGQLAAVEGAEVKSFIASRQSKNSKFAGH